MTHTFTIRVSRGWIVLAAVVMAVLLAVGIGACTNSGGGNAAEGAAQGASTNLLEQNQPLPIFPTSALRQNLIEIEAIQSLGSPTTTFFFPPGGSPNSGAAPIASCPSQGEPIPNTASLSNPHKPYQGPITTDGGIAVDQMDPNGIYAPTSSSGTYVLCVTSSGGVALHYWEGDVYTTSGSAVWNAATHEVQQVGPSQLPVCTVKQAADGDGTGLKAGSPYYHCVKA